MNKTLITFFTVLFCLTSSVGYSQNIICEKTGYGCPEIDFKDLVLRDGDYYKKFSNEPFTGKVNGEEQGSLKNGNREGSWVRYFDDGQLESKGNYKNGKKEGSWVWYFENGQLFYKGDYKNGSREGSWVYYKKDGTITEELSGTYKDGKKISKQKKVQSLPKIKNTITGDISIAPKFGIKRLINFILGSQSLNKASITI